VSRVPQEEAAIWHGKKPEREANEKLRKGLIRELGSGKHAVQDGAKRQAMERSKRAWRVLARGAGSQGRKRRRGFKGAAGASAVLAGLRSEVSKA